VRLLSDDALIVILSGLAQNLKRLSAIIRSPQESEEHGALEYIAENLEENMAIAKNLVGVNEQLAEQYHIQLMSVCTAMYEAQVFTPRHKEGMTLRPH